jgi:hypothetical protein
VPRVPVKYSILLVSLGGGTSQLHEWRAYVVSARFERVALKIDKEMKFPKG